MTVQTAFRLEESVIKMMKHRARLKRISLNAYVSELIENDLRNSSILPQVEIPETLDEDIRRLSGIMSEPTDEMLDGDERLKRIWER